MGFSGSQGVTTQVVRTKNGGGRDAEGSNGHQHKKLSGSSLKEGIPSWGDGYEVGFLVEPPDQMAHLA